MAKLHLPKSRFARWLLVGLAWLVVIPVLLEIALRVAAPMLPPRLAVTARWVMTGSPFSEDWTPAWQQNIDNYYALKPGLTDVLQYGSANVSFRLTTIELWAGGGIGFRTRPVDFFVHAVVVGDSFGFCFTELADCWVTKLQSESGINIVNLSQPVTGTTSHERILEGFGKPLKPPLVIWQFFGNDFNDDYGLAVFRKDIPEIPDAESAESAPDTSLMGWLRTHSVAFALVEQTLTGKWYGLPQAEAVNAKPYQVQYGDNTLYFGAQYEQQSMDMSRPRNQKGLELSRAAFQKAQALVKEWDGKLVVIIIPTREEVYAKLTAKQMGEKGMQALTSARDAMHGLCDELGLTCLDLLTTFQEHTDQGEPLMYYSDDMHLNPYGNQVMADAVNAWLVKENLMPKP